MAVRVNCPQCDQSYTLRDELIGKTVRCKTCGEVFPVTANLEDDEFEIVEDSVPDPRQSKRAPTKLRKQDSSQSSVLKWVLVGLGTVVVFFVATCGGLIIIGHRAAQKVQEQQREQAVAVKSDIPPAGGPSELFPVERYPMPEFPDLQPGQLIDGSGVTVRTVTILPKPEKVLQPGFQTQMRIYLPEGQHAPGTLPLVLVAPAGTPLFVGNRLDDPEYHDETLPYAEEGAVVIMYSLDGEVNLDQASDIQLGLAYHRFRDAGAGTVNARVALEFALHKIPAVDPKKIIVAGHSSAGALSMLYAAHEPRLAAAIAYCACTDVPTRMESFVTEVQGRPLFEGIGDFFKKSSPNTHVANIRCPVFVFHSFDDSNCPFSESQAFVAQLKAAGKDAVLSEPPAFGGHYQPMIDEGIPRAITWLRSRGILRPQ